MNEKEETMKELDFLDKVDENPLFNALRDAYPQLDIRAKSVYRAGWEPHGLFSGLLGFTYKGDVQLTITGSLEGPDYWETDVPGDDVKGGIFLLVLAALLGEQRALERCVRLSAACEADDEGRRALGQKDPLEQLLGPEDDVAPGGGGTSG